MADEPKKLLTEEQIADLTLVRDAIKGQVDVVDEVLGLTVDKTPAGMTAAQVTQASLLMAVGGIEMIKSMVMQIVEEGARPKRSVRKSIDQIMAQLKADREAQSVPKPKCERCSDVGSVQEVHDGEAKFVAYPACKAPTGIPAP